MEAGDESPDAGMMRAVSELREAMELHDAPIPPDVFSSRGATIIENFAPYIFDGEDVVTRWWRGFIAHANDGKLTELHASFGAAQDFDRSNDRIFFTLPTVWTGYISGQQFTEHGGWAFVLVQETKGWRIRSYAWAVTSVEFLDN